MSLSPSEKCLHEKINPQRQIGEIKQNHEEDSKNFGKWKANGEMGS